MRTGDIIDSRDLIERHDELREEFDELSQALIDAEDVLYDADGDSEKETELEGAVELAKQALLDWQAENGDEFRALSDVCDECSGYSDWTYGTSLIPHEIWVDYVEDLLKDIGDIPNNLPSYIVIDWESTAENIAVDYTTVTYNGDDYYIRDA